MADAEVSDVTGLSSRKKKKTQNGGMTSQLQSKPSSRAETELMALVGVSRSLDREYLIY